MPLTITEPDISQAWARLLLSVLDNAGTEITPLTLTATGITPNAVTECTQLKSAIDDVLTDLGLLSVENVAFTIFPNRLWHIVGGDRKAFYEVYKRAFPHYQSQHPDANGRGLYFERLISYEDQSPTSNQLEWIISQRNSRDGVRRSMYQASIFDPRRDHTAAAQLGFPCLQHVSFVPTSTELTINAFYATQQLLNKAYGNYLGLARLGGFIATHFGIEEVRLNVFVGVAKLEKLAKGDPAMSKLRAAAEACLAAGSSLKAS